MAACSSCLAALRQGLPEAQTVSAWEVLDGLALDLSQGLPAASSSSTGLPKIFSIQDPCTARHDKAWLAAVRSLAGVIDRVGLLRQDAATERNLRQAYRYYQNGPDSATSRAFARLFCHPEASIQMIGVWDTVGALGIPVRGLRAPECRCAARRRLAERAWR